MSGRLACLATIAGALLALPAVAHARAGDLDPSFGGGDGKVTLGVASGSHEGANGMALRPDGRIVLGGNTDAGGGHPNFAVVRLTAAGLPDPLFGSGGETSAHIAGFTSEGGHAVVVQSDGMPIVVGSADNNYAVARFRDPQGGLDSSFGSGGARTGQYFNSTLGLGLAAALDPNGKIVIAGDADGPSGQGTNFAVARLLNPQGTPDTSFESPNGSKTYDFASDTDSADAIVLQPDRRIVLAGRAGNDWGVLRLGANGGLDPSFGGGTGKTTVGFGAFSVARAVALQADGKILVTGQAGEEIGVVRFRQDGTLDTTFGSGGKLQLTIQGQEYGSGIAVQPDGKILVSAESSMDSGPSMEAVRLLQNGALDPDFGTGGKVSVPMGDVTFANAMALQPDGRIVLAGTSNSDFAAVRLLGDPPGAATADSTAPDIASASLVNRRFRVGSDATAEVARKKRRRRRLAPKGTAFRYTLSESANVTITIERAVGGLKLKRKGRKRASCLSASRKNKRALRRVLLRSKSIKRLHGRRRARALRRATRKLRCKLYKRVGTLIRNRQGPDAVRTPFSGRIGRRALKPGRYRATLQATDGAGNTSKKRRLAFTVVKRA